MFASKKIIATVLLFILFFQFEGASLLFFIKHIQIKNEVNERIASGLVSEAELVVIKLTKPLHQSHAVNFHWTDDHEFHYLGKMYDVVRQEEKGDSILYYCINDPKDELAHSWYKDSSHQNDVGEELEELARFMEVDYLNADFTCQFFNPAFILYGPAVRCNSLKIDILPPSPPPKV